MRKMILMLTFFCLPASGHEIVVESSSLAGPQQVSQDVPSQQVSVKEEMDLLPGITLASLSGAVSPRDKLFLRGFSPERVYVYLDEFPLNGSGIRGNFYVDLSTLIPDDLEKIEVVYGPSVVYGSNPGGNIIVRTKGFPTKRKLEINSLAGSYGTLKTNVSYRGNFGTTGLVVSAGGVRSEGYLRNDFLDGFHGKFEVYRLLDDTTSLRFFAERYRVKDGLPVLNDPGKSVTNYDGDYPVVKETYFSLACAPYCKLNLIYRSGDNYINRTTDRYGFSLLKDTGKGLLNFLVYANTSFKEERYYGLFKTPEGVKLTGVEFDGRDDVTYGWRVFYEDFDILGGKGTAGFEFQNSGYDQINKNGYLFVPGNRNALRRYAVFGKVKKEFPVFTVEGGLRIEKWKGNGIYSAPNVEGTEVLPSFRLSKEIKSTKIFIGAGRVYRPPRAEEILWYSKEYSAVKDLDSSYGLKAEKGWDYEFGVKQEFSNLRITTRIYRYEIRNFIISNFDAAKDILGESFPHRLVENLGFYRSNGVEITGSWNLREGTSVYMAYTYQDSRVSRSRFTPDKTPDPSVLIPKHKFVAAMTKKRILKSDALTVSATFYSDREGYREKIPGFGVVDVSYSISPTSNVAFNLRINNLFDKKYFYVENYEMPGRNYSISMKLTF